MSGTPPGGRSEPHRILVVRVGWMKYYAGSRQNDVPRPLHGGAFNEINVGLEFFNFLDLDGRLHGFAQAPGHPAVYNLRRISPEGTGDRLEHVTVVYVSRPPETGGQVVVGWYRNARVYRCQQRETDARRFHDGTPFEYHFECSTSDAVLLPLDRRQPGDPHVQHGHGGIGQANVFYPLNDRGLPRDAPWLIQLAQFILNYRGDNLLNRVRR